MKREIKNALFLLLGLILNPACQSQSADREKNYRSYGRCDGCDAIFEHGDRQFTAVDTLPEFDRYEPKIRLSGTVFEQDGKTPAPNVVLYVYQTDPSGRYPKKGDEKGWAKLQGYIRGWIKTDQEGRYTIYTFKPGSYGSGAAHIHAVVLEPNGRYYYIDDFNFEGDPNLGDEEAHRNEGGPGVVRLKQEGGLLVAERDIFLGLNIPGYE